MIARTSVIAAANPCNGHYDRAKTVEENLKMSKALLSRFDLLFILLDKPNEMIDMVLSEHVMDMHGKNRAMRLGGASLLSSSQSATGAAAEASGSSKKRRRTTGAEILSPLTQMASQHQRLAHEDDSEGKK